MEHRTERVVVLDFGGQYNQLIARRIRDLGVYSELVPYRKTAEDIARLNPKGIILSGGPASSDAQDAPVCDPAIFELGIPMLGIGYGMQLIGNRFGARMEPSVERGYGKAELEVVSDSPLFQGLGPSLTVWMSHSDAVVEPPSGFRIDGKAEAAPVAAMSDPSRQVLAAQFHPEVRHPDGGGEPLRRCRVAGKAESAPVAAMSDPSRQVFAVQFHPEVRHTDRGDEILRRFLFDVCRCAGNWTAESFIEETVKEIRERIGEKRVLCALSGGVDSSVTAVLIHRAIGDQLTCVFVDHG